MSNPSGDSFVHLHTHTEFSMLDGAARLDDLFTEAVRMGMPALAMTDHGNVFGAYEFWRKARAHGIKPIIGMEGYLAPGSRHERKRVTLGGQQVSDANPGEMYTHMTLLAENTEGMHNLFRLSSLASLEGYYYKPRMDRELLETYGKGIIATTGCPSGEVGPAAPAGPVRRRLPGGQRLPGHLRQGELLLRADGPRHRDREAGPAAAVRAEEEAGPAGPGHQRPALHLRRRRQVARGAALRADRQDAGRSEPVQVRRAGLLPQVARRDAPPVGPDLPRGVRQHAADRRPGPRRVHRGAGPDAPGPRAGGGGRSRAGWSRRSSGGCTGGSRTASPSSTAARSTTRSASSSRWAFPATSWWSRT